MIPRTSGLPRPRDRRDARGDYNVGRGRGQACGGHPRGWPRGLTGPRFRRARLAFEVVALELADRLPEPVGNRGGLSLRQIDEDERLARRHHQGVVLHAIRLVETGGAGVPDARDPDEDLQQVVEAGRRVVLDRARPHHELVVVGAAPEQAEVPEVLDPRLVEVRQVPAVVDDTLRVGFREADACQRRVLERRLALRDAPELEHEPLAAGHERITSSTSSRFSSISSSERASRFSRNSGSVLEGRTLKCQSSASTETPSRWDTVPSEENRRSSSASFTPTSGTGVFSSPVMKYRSRSGRRISESFCSFRETSSSISRNGITPESACEKSRK